MDNLKSPAYPTLFYNEVTGNVNGHSSGFTKLEKAALMIAQGYTANELQNEKSYADIARWSVDQARAVLEKANE